MPTVPGPSGSGHQPGLVETALTGLKQGMNPYAAVVFAFQQVFKLALPTPPGGSPPAPPSPTGGSGGNSGGAGSSGGRGGNPPPHPPPPPPPPPCKTQKCPRGFYWDKKTCACEPNPGYI